MSTIDEQRREAFGEIAQLYDDARPVYPDALIEDVLGLSRFPVDGTLLEIGCGTGIATRMFSEKGCRIVALEPAPEMAAIARKKFRRFSSISIIEEKFEQWDPADERFDLVVSAQAFHWIRPEIAYRKSALLLKSSGKLGLFCILDGLLRRSWKMRCWRSTRIIFTASHGLVARASPLKRVFFKEPSQSRRQGFSDR